ncbi:dihydrofolate reductase family protein [Microbacter sp. GSS18]|nr:dihydrofolate reductase family protein [Microbacter sp. GSS18]
MLQSLDGYVADADGALVLPPPGPALHRHFNDELRETSLLVYGRRMWEVMRYWAGLDADRDEAAAEFAALWQSVPKVVVSTTLDDAGDGVRIIRENVVEAVGDLLAGVPGDVEVAGPTLAAALGAAGLIDEYRLYLQPVVLGGGLPMFADGFRPTLDFAGAETLPDGVVMLRYVR